MKLDDQGYRLIKSFEGLSLKPYLDLAKVPTIGYGNTYYLSGKKVSISDPPITESFAFELFKKTADNFAAKIKVNSKINQSQFNALVSLAYNIGLGAFKNSTLLKKVNAHPGDKTISEEFLKWNKAGGKVVAGLKTRRLKESKLYFTP